MQLRRQCVDGSFERGRLALDAMGLADRATAGHVIDGLKQFRNPLALARGCWHDRNAQISGQSAIVDL
jgi:hypothetical protein